MNLADCLSPEEEAVLAVFKVHRIRYGFGLTTSTFARELSDRPGIDIRRVLGGMVQRGLLKVLPEVPDFYILTRSGEVLSGPPPPAP
jgi:hypothetical protein